MTETEATPPSLEPEPALPPPPKSGRTKKVARHVCSIALLVGLGAAGVLYSTRLNSPLPPASDTQALTSIEERLSVLEGRLKELNEKASAPQQAADLKPLLQETFQKVEERLAQVESKGMQDRQIIQKAIAAAFAFRDLREAAKDGRNFASELAALRVATVGDAPIAELETKLDPFAITTPPTVQQLREALTVEEKAASAAPQPDQASNWWTRIKAAFQPLVSVRPLHDPRYADLEKALDTGNAPAALEAAKALPDEAKKPLAVWLSKLEARIALDAAIQEIAGHFSTPTPSSPVQGSAP